MAPVVEAQVDRQRGVLAQRSVPLTPGCINVAKLLAASISPAIVLQRS